MDKKSMTMGCMVGKLIAGMRRIKKEPVAYLYNGMELPPLPEKYQYATIVRRLFWGAVQYTILYITSEPLVFHPDNITDEDGTTYAGPWLKCDETHKNVKYKLTTVDGVETWNLESSEVKETYRYQLSAYSKNDYKFWASYDIIKTTDGTVFKAGTDPVPVYE